MIEQKTVYVVNGKEFDNLEGAKKEEDKLTVEDCVPVAKKFIELVNVNNKIAKMVIDDELCDVEINVNDKELYDDFFVTKKYASTLKKFLTKLGVKFRYSDGDERRVAYMKIDPVNEVRNIPTVSQTVEFILKTIKEEEIERENRKNELLRRK